MLFFSSVHIVKNDHSDSCYAILNIFLANFSKNCYKIIGREIGKDGIRKKIIARNSKSLASFLDFSR